MRNRFQNRRTRILASWKGFAGMRRLLLGSSLVMIIPFAAAAQSSAPGQVVITSAADFGPAVAPNSLVSVFGQGLAARPALATFDGRGNLPTSLGGTRVLVDGRPAPLIYVSPDQVNCVIPSETSTGLIDVVVESSAGAMKVGSVTVQPFAPAIFTWDSSGSGPGVVVNAVTFDVAPFQVETPGNPGSDKRTRLSIFATGLGLEPAKSASQAPTVKSQPAIGSLLNLRKLAEHLQAPVAVLSPLSALGPEVQIPELKQSIDVRVEARSESGRFWDLPVEYAGPAPGFAGLDQINVVLLPEMGDVDSISLTLSVGSFRSNTVTAALDPIITLPPADPCGVVGQCVDISGSWRAEESVTLTCTIRALGESVTESENLSGRATVNIRDEGDCGFSAPIVLDSLSGSSSSARVTFTVDGTSVSGSGPVAVAQPGADVRFTTNRNEITGEVCGDEMNLTSRGRLSFSAEIEGVTVTADCTTSGRGVYRRSSRRSR